MIRWALIVAALALAGCGDTRATDPADRAERVVASQPSNPARDVLAGTVRELREQRDAALHRQREAESEAAAQKAHVARLDSAIQEGETRQRQTWLRALAGGMVVVALLCIGLAVWLPLLRRRMLVGAGAAIAVAGCALVFAWLLPYLLWVGAAVVLAVVTIVVLDLLGEHKLSRQVLAGVERLKGHVPEYKGILREVIDSDVDARIDRHRGAK